MSRLVYRDLPGALDENGRINNYELCRICSFICAMRIMMVPHEHENNVADVAAAWTLPRLLILLVRL